MKLGKQVREILGNDDSANSGRITVTELNSKAPPQAKTAHTILTTLPDKHRGGVVKFGILVLGALAAFAIWKGWKL